MASLSGLSPSDDPNQTRGPALLAVAWTTTSLAVVMVSLRVYVKMFRKNLGWDDYSILIALALCIFGSATVTLAVQNGFGRHLDTLTFAEIPQALKWAILAELSAYFTTYFIKLSVCLFVFRLMANAQESKAITRILYVLMAVMSIVCFVSVVTLATECIPFSDVWNLFAPNRRCQPYFVQPLLVKIYGVIGAVTDVACVACPVYVVRKLQMPLHLKFAVIFLISLGLFTAGCSIAKAVTADLATFDGTYDLVTAAIWQLLEQNIGVCVACAPTLRQLFNRKRGTAKSSGGSSEKKGSGSNKRFPDRIREFWYDSVETTNVSHQTATSGGDTLPIEDLEAGTARSPNEKGFTRIEKSPATQIEEHSVNNETRSIHPIIERSPYVDIDIIEPVSTRARNDLFPDNTAPPPHRWRSSVGTADSHTFSETTLKTPRSDQPLISPSPRSPVQRINEEDRREQRDQLAPLAPLAPSLGAFPWEGDRAHSWYKPLWRASSAFNSNSGSLDAAVAGSGSRHPVHSRANQYQMRWM